MSTPSDPLTVVFFGSAEFAATALCRLVSSRHRVAAVVTRQDKRQGRGMAMQPTPVKRFCLEAGLPALQPADVNSAESVARLKDLAADVFVVIAYGQKLSSQVLALPRIMPVNIHASLLPAYRGAAPINWALINGEERTGVSSMKMVERMDAGPVILAQSLRICPQDTAVTLERSLAQSGAQLLMDTLELLCGGAFELKEQDEAKATHAPKLRKSDGLIDWRQACRQIRNRVAGCQPWPGAYTYYKGKMLKVFSCRCLGALPPQAEIAQPGEICRLDKEALAVRCGDGLVCLDEVQAEGGRRMPAAEFVAGHALVPGERFLLH